MSAALLFSPMTGNLAPLPNNTSPGAARSDLLMNLRLEMPVINTIFNQGLILTVKHNNFIEK
jgi:hypothetical protein